MSGVAKGGVPLTHVWASYEGLLLCVTASR